MKPIKLGLARVANFTLATGAVGYSDVFYSLVGVQLTLAISSQSAGAVVELELSTDGLSWVPGDVTMNASGVAMSYAKRSYGRLKITAGTSQFSGVIDVCVNSSDTPSAAAGPITDLLVHAKLGKKRQRPINLFFQGSSTTAQGSGPSFTAINTNGFAEIAASNLALPGFVAWRKYGVGSTDFTDYSTSAPANVDTYIKTGCLNVLVVQGIKNGPQSGWTTQQTVDRVKAYCSARKAAGWDRVIVALPCHPIYAYATFSTAMLSAIPALLADSSLSDGTVADGFVRWDANPSLKNGQDDTTDGLHWITQGWTKAGRAAAEEVAAALASAGAPPITSAITSPLAGATISADTAVDFSVTGALDGYTAELYASVATSVSGGPNEALSLLATGEDVTSLVAPFASIPSAVSYLYVFINDGRGRRGVSARVAVTKVATPEAPAITSQPAAASVTDGNPASFSVTATGTAPLSYQWQVSTDAGSTWGDCSGAPYSNATTATLGVAAVLAMSGYSYRCVVANAQGSATSNAAALTVSAGAVAPSITAHPSDSSVTDGSNASFSASASGTAPLSYQWQSSADDGASWANCVAGATYSNPTTTTLGVAAVLAMDGTMFRCVVTNAQGSATSNAATLTVTAQQAAVLIDDQFGSGTWASGRVPDTVGAMAWDDFQSTSSMANGEVTFSSAARARINPGQADRIIETEITLRGASAVAWLTTRFSSTTNRIVIAFTPTSVTVNKYVASSTATQVATQSFTMTPGTVYPVRIVSSGTENSVYINDTLIVSASVPEHTTVTPLAIGSFGTASPNCAYGFVRVSTIP